MSLRAQTSFLPGKSLVLPIWLMCMVPSLFAAEGASAPSVKQGLVVAPTSAVYVHPTSAPLGTPRTVFFVDARLTGCMSQSYAFDASALDTQNLISIRFDLTPQPCGVPPPSYPTFKAYTVTPSRADKLTIRATRNGQAEIFEAEVTSTSAPRSSRNVNGMWFDPTTNGSGIAMHHSRASDAVFGTWFIFNLDGSTRWYTMQQAYWRGNGDILEGLLFGMSGNCPEESHVACPARASVRTLPLGTLDPTTSYPAGAPFLDAVVARFTFTSDTAARAEVLDLAGNVLFVSQLIRLGL